jgi:hypothetical protein
VSVCRFHATRIPKTERLHRQGVCSSRYRSRRARARTRTCGGRSRGSKDTSPSVSNFIFLDSSIQLDSCIMVSKGNRWSLLPLQIVHLFGASPSNFIFLDSSIQLDSCIMVSKRKSLEPATAANSASFWRQPSQCKVFS